MHFFGILRSRNALFVVQLSKLNSCLLMYRRNNPLYERTLG